MHFLITLTLFGLMSAVAPTTPTTPTTPYVGRIVGGSSTTIQLYPFMSNTQFLANGQWWTHWCGGTLVSPTTVLSAAHCYYDNAFTALWRIRLGSSFASSGGSVHHVLRFLFHEDYNHTSLIHDVALIRLTWPAGISSTVGVANLAPPTFNLAIDSVVTAFGWGALGYIGLKPEQLQHVDLSVVNQQTCTDRYRSLQTSPGFEWWPYHVTDDMFCSGTLDGGRDVCDGDSGGPVVARTFDEDFVVGITSWGYSCANGFYPGVNVKVSHYYDWIKSNV